MLLNSIDCGFGENLAAIFECSQTCFTGDPVDLRTRGRENVLHGCGDLRADAVPGDQNYF